MPYIKPEFRAVYDPNGGMNDHATADTSGQLNFQLTSIIKAYLSVNGKSYQTINDIVGALEGAKLEFYRRVVVPYEDSKIKENGDVY